MTRCVFLTEFLVCSVVTDLHLVWFITHTPGLEPVVHGFLDPDVDTVVFVVFGDSIQMNCIAVNSDGILAIFKYHDVVLKVFGVQRSLLQEVLELILLDECCLLKQFDCIMKLFK